MADIRVIHTIAGTRVDHGGTSRCVPSLCDTLVEVGATVQFVAGCPANAAVECIYPKKVDCVRTVVESRVHRAWGMASHFQQALRCCLDSVEGFHGIVHDHGLWLPTNRAVAKESRRQEIARIVSPHGMLSQWAMGNGRMKKKIAWRLFQRHDLQSATAFHATGDQEAEDLRALGFRQPIAVIPNGVSLPVLMPEKELSNGRRRVLFLSRIHPKKGLLNLVRAWHDVSPEADWTLVLAGPDENGHQCEVESLARKLGVLHQFEFTGAVADEEKWKLYRSADFFVLPSFSENFGIVVAEALAAGLPVITTTATPWQNLSPHRIGWWVDPTVDDLKVALGEALSLAEPERLEMGERAKDWAQNRFSWPAVGRQMMDFYSWLLGIGDKPEFVV
jgi:glycosyltransferase involved in cell wall biosynthesis